MCQISGYARSQERRPRYVRARIRRTSLVKWCAAQTTIRDGRMTDPRTGSPSLRYWIRASDLSRAIQILRLCAAGAAYSPVGTLAPAPRPEPPGTGRDARAGARDVDAVEQGRRRRAGEMRPGPLPRESGIVHQQVGPGRGDHPLQLGQLAGSVRSATQVP